MAEKELPKDLQKQITNCPIHQLTNVTLFMNLANMPEEFRIPFHKLLIIRGQLPLITTNEQDMEWVEKAGKIFTEHNIEDGPDRLGLLALFVHLRDYWINKGTGQN